MGYLRLLRTPPVAGLWGAQLLAVMGARLYALAVMWLMWEATGSAFLMGLVAVVESVPYIVMGTAGRRILARVATLPRLAAVEGARAFVVAVLPLLWSAPEARTPALLAVALLLGVTGAMIDPVLPGLVPSLVGRADARPVMGLLDLTGRIARILGPGSAGALLLVVTEVQFYWLTAAGFAVSAAALAVIGRTHVATAPPRRAEPAERGLPAVRELVRAHPAAGFALGLHGLGVFASTASGIGMPILLTTRFGADAGEYGMVAAITAAGALAGNLAVGNMRLGGWLRVYCAAWAVSGLALAAMGAAPDLVVLSAVALVSGAAMPLSGVTFQGFVAARFTEAERVAVLALDHVVIRAAGTAGMLIVPVLVAAHPPLAFAACGLAVAAAAMAGMAAAPRLAPAPEPVRA